jgi:low affinity Fe/Cu permease
VSEPTTTSIRDRFNRVASAITGALGSPFALIAAIALIVGWAVTGPLFGFSESWQLIINTGTTIVTFLMVFVIQASQNRDSKAIHLKLDEVIRAVKGARNELIGEEASSEAKIHEHEQEFLKIAEEAGLAAVESAPGAKSVRDAAGTSANDPAMEAAARRAAKHHVRTHPHTGGPTQASSGSPRSTAGRT